MDAFLRLISVVAPVHNGREMLLPWLASLWPLPGRSFEMIFIGRCLAHHPDRTSAPSWARSASARVLNHGANAVKNRAVRTGVLAARGEIVW
jgi:dolichol-phosphate mannosyltransferase